MNNPPAGWYDDPSRPGFARYWDGERWTEHVRAVDQPVEEMVAQDPSRAPWGSPAPTGAGTATEKIAERAYVPRPRFTRRRGAVLAVSCIAVFVVLGMLSPVDGGDVVIDTSASSIAPVTADSDASEVAPDAAADRTPETPDGLTSDLGGAAADVWSDETGVGEGTEAQPEPGGGAYGSPVEFASSVWVLRTLAIGWASPDGWQPVRYVVTVRWSSGKKSITTTKESLSVKGASKQACTITIAAVDAKGARVSARPFACGSELG